ncbi:MAG: hypothetical protein IJ666_01810 [Ruminococcus sp.]|nr:hypothetical protein [Ruminococcus sp.]
MKKKDTLFIIGLTMLMGIIWVLGELVMGLWIAVVPRTHAFWTAGIVILTVIISVWHSMLEDESDRTDPKVDKYYRKKEKRSKKHKR